MVGARIKIMWEEQLVDLPNEYKDLIISHGKLQLGLKIECKISDVYTLVVNK